MSFAQILSGLDAKARDKLDRKLPSWAGRGVQVPSSINLEQCSSETAALYKASLIDAGVRVADLTGGLGADSWAFSGRASAVWYNERDAALLEAVKHNFAALELTNVEFNCYDISASADDWKQALNAFRPDFIYLDPARRGAGGQKLFLLEDCSPDVVALMPELLAIAPRVMVKVSPMADLTMLRRRLSPYLESIHVVGADGECKELLCLCRQDASFSGIVLSENGRISYGPDSASVPPESGRQEPDSASAELLFVPSAAMVKSGLGPGLCLMGYDEELSHFGKFWQVVENLPFASSVLKSVGARYPQADVTARGVPVSSDELRKKMKTKPGGPVHIFACAIGSDRRILVCRPLVGQG